MLAEESLPAAIGEHAITRPVRCKHGMVCRGLVAGRQGDLIGQRRRAGLEGNRHTVEQSSQGIGLGEEAFGMGLGVTRIADGHLPQRGAVDLLQEKTQQRLVGAPDRGGDGCRRQTRFSRTTCRGILEHPGLHRLVRLAGGKLRHQRVERARNHGVDENGHELSRPSSSCSARPVPATETGRLSD